MIDSIQSNVYKPLQDIFIRSNLNTWIKKWRKNALILLGISIKKIQNLILLGCWHSIDLISDQIALLSILLVVLISKILKRIWEQWDLTDLMLQNKWWSDALIKIFFLDYKKLNFNFLFLQQILPWWGVFLTSLVLRPPLLFTWNAVQTFCSILSR